MEQFKRMMWLANWLIGLGYQAQRNGDPIGAAQYFEAAVYMADSAASRMGDAEPQDNAKRIRKEANNLLDPLRSYLYDGP